MAQLPPKIPSTIPQNWPYFPHQRGSSSSSSSTMSNITSTTTTQNNTCDHQQSPPSQQVPSWIDEFLDFSSVRRGAHRRSASDSIAFLETSFLEEDCRSGGGGGGGFDRLDDDQLISMFSDNVAGVSFPPLPLSSTSNPSSPSSDQNSNNNEEKPMAMVLDAQPQEHYLHHEVKPKDEAVDDDSSCKNEAAAAAPSSSGNITCTETVVDPKRVKRILANRQSAQRSRVRKLQYISELERSVTSLQTEVSALSPRVAFLDHQRMILTVDNSAIKQRIAALAQDKLFKDAHQEALKKEIERLRQIYHQQNIQKMGNSVNNNINNGHSLQSPTPTSQPQQQSFHQHKEQILS